MDKKHMILAIGVFIILVLLIIINNQRIADENISGEVMKTTPDVMVFCHRQCSEFEGEEYKTCMRDCFAGSGSL